MKLTEIRSHSKPVEVALDDTNKITFTVFTRKSTVTQQREFQKKIDERMSTLEENRKLAVKLDRERETLLRPVAALNDEIEALQKNLSEAEPLNRAALRDQISDKEYARDDLLSAIEPQLKALEEKAVAMMEEAQKALQRVLAEKLAFFVKDHDVTDEEGKPLSADAKFFENFDFNFLQMASDAVDGALSGPLSAKSSASS